MGADAAEPAEYAAAVAFFALAYVCGLAGFRAIGWPAKDVGEAASMIGGFVHCTGALVLCCPLALATLRATPAMRATLPLVGEVELPDFSLCAANPVGTAHATHLTLSYYSVDIFHYLLVNTGEPLFLLHHMAVISMVAAVVYTGAGGMLPLTVTSLVELPSPVQMVWSYARDGRRRFPALGGIYAAISPWFTLLYVLARVVGGGIFLIYVIFYLWSGQVAACDSQTGLLGAGTKGLHTFLCCGGFLGSSMWARTLVAGYFKFRARQAGAKSGTSKAD